MDMAKKQKPPVETAEAESSQQMEDTPSEVSSAEEDIVDDYVHTWLQSPELKDRETKIKETILDALELLQMRSQYVVDEAYRLFDRMGGNRQQHAFMNRAKLAYGLWEALNRQKTPRSVRDIAHVFSVEPKQLLKLEKTFKLQSTFAEVKDYVEPVCAFLTIKRKLRPVVEKIITEIQDEHYGRTPEVLIAAVIVKTFLYSGTELTVSEQFDLTPDRMCKILDISWKNVREVANIIPQYEHLTGTRKWQRIASTGEERDVQHV